jgi:hypothetical protein
MRRIGHLAARFAASIVPVPVRASDASWVEGILAAGELALWHQMSRPDRVEGVRVARRTANALGPGEPSDQHDDWLAAALLHDVGKLDARLGPYRRAVATIAGRAAPGMTGAWRESTGFTRRVGLYLDHAALGADRIRIAGGREVAARWAAAHHDPSRWAATGIPLAVCRALATADGEQLASEGAPSAGSDDCDGGSKDLSKDRNSR